MRTTLSIFISILFICSLTAQIDNCNCDEITQINVCFLAREELCDGIGSSNCGITLDHQAQRNGIAAKLTNQENFGPGGTVECSINLKPLPNIFSVGRIYQEDCHIFYVGHFPIDSTNGGLIFSKSFIPQETLSAIREWSLECPRNLAIIPQIEADTWGYTIEDENENPNQPVEGSNIFFSIFDGPFGTASSFNQGGSYQGVITETPETGFTFLAVDNNDRPTIALDHVTSDIIVGDIGLFCDSPWGNLTETPWIFNSNDIFACNIFALGCNIVSGEFLVNEAQTICKGDTIISPTGKLLTEEGNYLDTIKTFGACDTIVNTRIDFFQEEGYSAEFQVCRGDGFTIEFNNQVYDENNSSGTETLVSSMGCDSIVDILIEVLEPSTFLIDGQYCENSDFVINVNGVDYNTSNPLGIEVLQNAVGCDSTVTIDLEYILKDSYFDLELAFCENGNDEFIINGTSYSVQNNSGIEILTNNVGCDSVVSVQVGSIPVTFGNINPTICQNDAYSVSVNGTAYDVNNPSGQETIIGSNGCDSIVTIEFNILPLSYQLLSPQVCNNDNDFQLEINGTSYNIYNPQGQEILIGSNGCDSIVDIFLDLLALDTTSIPVGVCKGESIEIDGIQYFSGEVDSILYSAPDRCDSLVIYEFYTFDDPSGYVVDSLILVSPNDRYELEAQLPPGYQIIWDETLNFSCHQCPETVFYYDGNANHIQSIILDENDCEAIATTLVETILDPYIPNVISTTGNGENKYFNIFYGSELLRNNIQIAELVIFDRWGNIVHRIKDTSLINLDQLWDGTMNGERLSQGVFIYQLKLLIDNTEMKFYQGSLTLLN